MDIESPVASGTSPAPLSSTGSIADVPILPETHHGHDTQPAKCRKVEEVDTAHILPDHLQRNRTKSAKAAAATLETMKDAA